MEQVDAKAKFITISIKKNILPFMFCIFAICLVIFSKGNVNAARDGMMLWANAVVPSLLPFFIATELLSHTNVVPFLGKICNPLMRPFFNVPGIGAFAFLMGIISGYPIGAKIVTDFRQKNLCTKEEGERLLTFTNNSGPLFIIGTVGITLLGDTQIGFLLFLTHILACISVGILFRFWKSNIKGTIMKSKQKHQYINNSPIDKKGNNNLGNILGGSINNSINTVVMIGGFVILFSVIISILNQSKILEALSTSLNPILNGLNINTDFAKPILTGIIELTNGVNQIALVIDKKFSLNVILASFVLGFGGISVVLQVYSIISKTDISIKPYIIGKFMQGLLASLYTYIFIRIIPIFNLDIIQTSVETTRKITKFQEIQTNNYFILLSTVVIILWLLCFCNKKRNLKRNITRR